MSSLIRFKNIQKCVAEITFKPYLKVKLLNLRVELLGNG